MSEPVEIECKFIHYTGQAVKVDYDGKYFWIPERSIMGNTIDLRTLNKGDDLTLEIPEWLALQEGLI